MIRVLVLIAVTGFLVSVICLSVAVGIAGPDAITRGDWTSWNPGRHWIFGRNHDHWGFHRWSRDREDRDDDDSDDGGPQTSRQIAWSGGDSLDVDLPANVQYTQAPGPAKLTVTGPRGAVADVEVEDGHVRFTDDRDHDTDLTIVMTAPSVSRFQMSGSGRLSIAGYNQDKLIVDLSGDADATAKGAAKAVDISISGSGNADLGDVKAQSATVEIEGSGDATLAPTDAAKVDISGSGDVTLLRHPPRLESNVSGSGSVHQEARTTAKL